MQLGMIGLGRMGANLCRRLMAAGHQCAVYDTHPDAVATLVGDGAAGASSLEDLIGRLRPPRALWLMVPAAAVEAVLNALAPLLVRGDTVIDGGNSHYRDDIRRARQLGAGGIHYLDVGTSGGVWGREQGYCLMVGGERAAVEQLSPIFDALAPGVVGAARTPGRSGPVDAAERGWLHCGASGAGHFVKMVHNGIEYGIMAAYAEGLNLLRHANRGGDQLRIDAETAPLDDPEAYQYDFDLGAIAELWRRGSVIRSWLLDLTAQALHKDPTLSGFRGRVSDSGEGRWTLKAAIDTGVPVPVLSAALFERFSSQGHSAFADQVLSALRSEFGGHAESHDGEPR